MPRGSAWFQKKILQMEARERNGFSNAKQLHLTIRDASKLIVSKDGKVMQGEDIGHKTRESSLLQNAQATIYETAEELLQSPPASIHGANQELMGVGVLFDHCLSLYA